MRLSNLFNIATSSLFTFQQALSITSNNIANANNPNYSRQKLIMGSEKPEIIGGFEFGKGVKIEDIMRVRNGLTDTQIRAYNEIYWSANKSANILGGIESLFSDPSEVGLGGLVDQFFNSWEELSVDPASSPLRTSVVQSAQKLAAKLQTTYKGIQNVKSNIKAESHELVKSVNTITKQLQVLNGEIYTSQINGGMAGDLLDKRDELIDKLSELVNINVSYDNSNVANIAIGGVFAVDRFHSVDLKMEELEGGRLVLKSADGNGTVSLTGGELYAVKEMYTNTIPGYLEHLDRVGNHLMESVNAVHNKGYNITDPPGTGLNFFESYDNGVLKINSEILEDTNFIAASIDGAHGNNDLALLIAEIKGQKVDGEFTISEIYTNLVSGLGHDKQLQDQNTDSYELVLNQLQNQKSAYSGVSIDEEMTNMLKFEKSYQAAARLINVADDMFDTLLNMI